MLQLPHTYQGLSMSKTMTDLSAGEGFGNPRDYYGCRPWFLEADQRDSRQAVSITGISRLKHKGLYLQSPPRNRPIAAHFLKLPDKVWHQRFLMSYDDALLNHVQ